MSQTFGKDIFVSERKGRDKKRAKWCHSVFLLHNVTTYTVPGTTTTSQHP